MLLSASSAVPWQPSSALPRPQLQFMTLSFSLSLFPQVTTNSQPCPVSILQERAGLRRQQVARGGLLLGRGGRGPRLAIPREKRGARQPSPSSAGLPGDLCAFVQLEPRHPGSRTLSLPTCASCSSQPPTDDSCSPRAFHHQFHHHQSPLHFRPGDSRLGKVQRDKGSRDHHGTRPTARPRPCPQ